MQGWRQFEAAAAAVCCVTACSSSPPVAHAVDAGKDGRDAAGSFGVSACEECIESACAPALAVCASDPDCSAYWSCVEGCGVSTSGDVDSTCEGACPRGASTAGTEAELGLTHCRNGGTGSLCVPCGTPTSSKESPILRQECTAILVDASTDVCKKCLDQHCCKTQKACDTTACKSYYACMAEYDDFTKCETAYPDGFLPAEQEQGCYLVFCSASSACGGTNGSFLECFVEECSVEYAAVLGTVAGANYWECLLSTFDTAGCMASYPEGSMQAAPLIDCIAEECESYFP